MRGRGARVWVGLALLVLACSSRATHTDGSGGGGAAGSSTGGAPGGGGSSGLGGAGATGGCTPVTGGSAGASGDDGGLPDAGATTSITGQLVTLQDNYVGVANAKVCLYGKSICTTSGKDGKYTLSGVPAFSELLLEYTAAGYFPMVGTVYSTSTNVDIGSFPAPTMEEALALGVAWKEPLQSGRGHVLAQVISSVNLGVIGATAFATGGCPPPPHYFGNGTKADPGATSTNITGAAVFLNAVDSQLFISMKHPNGSDCQRRTTTWGSDPYTARAPIIPDHITIGIVFDC